MADYAPLTNPPYALSSDYGPGAAAPNKKAAHLAAFSKTGDWVHQ